MFGAPKKTQKYQLARSAKLLMLTNIVEHKDIHKSYISKGNALVNIYIQVDPLFYMITLTWVCVYIYIYIYMYKH